MGHVLATLNADRRPLHHRGLDYAIATFFGCCYFGLIALRRAYPVDAHTIVRHVPIAFDNASVDALAAKLQSGAVDFGKIGAAGRKWALEHYTPTAYGARFLADVARVRRRKKER